MSNFDPRSPSYTPPGAVLATDGTDFNYAEANQSIETLLSSSVISASTAVSVGNFGCKGALFFLDVTSVPGSGSTTVALKLQVTSPRTAQFATRAAVSLGASLFMVYPGISASAGGVSSPLPRRFSALLSLSTGATSKEVQLSLSMMRLR